MGSKIKIRELEEIFNLIISKLEFEFNKGEIELNDDLYRIIPTQHWSITKVENELIGSLNDDINELKKLISDTSRPTTFVDLDRCASLLRAISERFNSAIG
ncbi:hypothetical protein CW751_14520 [Brumimicrobium salinarum]|uniref:Uncharacterized protein n=1 Tax=Brumimicrobium salinarum TaxID=2058658 RepID=A0A2I0QZ06_9FLAO|nr:hypothetical protein [Brumimicrobium salinarum]PKR79561.1 hypothetical protein CW751_14520 [Brumimicrobium salinarum]